MACEKDVFSLETSGSQEPRVSVSTIYGQKIKANAFVAEKIELLSRRANIQGRGGDTLSLEIDTTFARYAKTADGSYHSYTFKVLNPPKDTYQNLTFSSIDGGYQIFLVNYYLTENQVQLVRSGKMNPVSYTEITDLDILSDGGYQAKENPCDGITSYYVAPEECGGQDHHDYGEECPYEGTSLAATPGYWVVEYVPCTGAGTGVDTSNPPIFNPGDFEDPNGTITIGGADGNNYIPTILCDDCPELEQPFLKSGCKKIKKLFEEHPNYKDELIALAAKTSETVENGIFIDDVSSNVQTVPPGTSGKLDISNDPTNPYVSIAHTHNSPDSTTYSVFSWDDLAFMARAMENGKIKTNKFVAFLMTADGTNYALTINDPGKLMDLFYHPNGGAGDMADVEKMIDMERVFKEYYDPDNAEAKIEENNTDDNADRNALLQLLRDNDCGVDLFECDDTFTTFEKLMLNANNTDVTKENCND